MQERGVCIGSAAPNRAPNMAMAEPARSRPAAGPKGSTSACQADARRVSIFNNLSVQIKIATRHGERSVRSPVDLYFRAFALFFSDLDKKGRIQRIGDENAIAREKAMKKWRREWKIRLIEEQNPD